MTITFTILPPPTPREYRYAVVRTDWGELAFLGTGDSLCRVIFGFRGMMLAEEAVKLQYPTAKLDETLMPSLQKEIAGYFMGHIVDFNCKVDISWASDFSRDVLRCCAGIRPGRTVTYGRLAKLTGRPKAARAVGNVLAGNPVPLIIPCHRIVAANGGLGGYSAPGGTILKRRLLNHEATVSKINKLS